MPPGGAHPGRPQSGPRRPAMTPSADPPVPATGRPVSRRDVLRSAGVLAVGGVGVAAGYGLRGLVDTQETAVTPVPMASPVLIAAASGSPAPSAPPAEQPPGPRHAFRS